LVWPYGVIEVAVMDINQLKTLIHVAELGSVSKASERLGIAQPALSRQIRLLEQELGTYLFERHGRGMDVTEIGREVLDHATRILAEIDAIRNLALDRRVSYRGTVSVGTTPTVAEIVTVPLVQTIRQAHPHLNVRLSAAFSGHMLNFLQRGEIDIAVIYNLPAIRSLKIDPVLVENLLLVGAGERGLRLDRAIPFSDLSQERLILPSAGHRLRDIIDDCARQAGLDLSSAIETDSFQSMINLVRAGLGSTVLPLAPLYSLVERCELSVSPLVDPTPSRKLVIAYPADRPVSLAARFVGDTIREIAADLVARNIWVGHMIGHSK
jgi:DNA-binding transcriptional LysR family regulator